MSMRGVAQVPISQPLSRTKLDGRRQVGFLQQRLVTLDVGNHLKVGVLLQPGHLGHPISPGGMIGGGELHGGPHSPANLGHLLRIRGDHGFIQDPHTLHPSPNPLDEGAAEEGVERLVGEAGGGEPGRDDAQNAAAHRRHPAPRSRVRRCNFHASKGRKGGYQGARNSGKRVVFFRFEVGKGEESRLNAKRGSESRPQRFRKFSRELSPPSEKRDSGGTGPPRRDRANVGSPGSPPRNPPDRTRPRPPAHLGRMPDP